MLDFLRKHNPKHFYNLFSKGKSRSGKSSLTNDDFQAYMYFKSLIESNTESICDPVNENAVYGELDEEITCEEIRMAIKKLNVTKAVVRTTL